MKELALLSSDEKALYFIPEDTILEAAPGENGTTLLAIVELVEVKSDIEQVKSQVSKNKLDRIKWHTVSPTKSKARQSRLKDSTNRHNAGLQ